MIFAFTPKACMVSICCARLACSMAPRIRNPAERMEDPRSVRSSDGSVGMFKVNYWYWCVL